MLRVNSGGLTDLTIRDLPTLLRPGDILVTNNTRVFPAQLEAVRGLARIGITLDRPRPDGVWQALARNSRRVRVGDVLTIEGAPAVDTRGPVADDAVKRGQPPADVRRVIAPSPVLTARVVDKAADGSVGLAFNLDGAGLMQAFHQAGVLALPPYIHRPDGPQHSDEVDYQTIFAAREGAVAAPTAGLHFTSELLAELQAMGVQQASVTLHVGIGTFLPVRVERVIEHQMHAERGEITTAVADQINQARRVGGRVIAVGTTSLRLLESAARPDGMVRPFLGETSLFILPGYRFKVVNRLLTNFHLPRSTLLMLVSAFAGRERMLTAYAHAVASGYRFHSYGDACFLDGLKI